MSTTLYDLALQGIEIEEMLFDSVGEITPEIQERLDALLESGVDKMEAAAAVIRQLELSAMVAEEEAKRLHERAKQFSAQADKLNERMTFALDKAFSGKVKTPKWTIWTQKAKDVTVAELIPGVTVEMLYKERPDLVRVKMDVDRIKIVQMYKDPETRKALPELLLFEERPGKRYTRLS
jgi:hypothetical protein